MLFSFLHAVVLVILEVCPLGVMKPSRLVGSVRAPRGVGDAVVLAALWEGDLWCPDNDSRRCRGEVTADPRAASRARARARCIDCSLPAASPRDIAKLSVLCPRWMKSARALPVLSPGLSLAVSPAILSICQLTLCFCESHLRLAPPPRRPLSPFRAVFFASLVTGNTTEVTDLD